MPGTAHNKNESNLKSFLKKKVPDFFDSKYERYGRWTDSISEAIKEKKLNGSIPDLMLLSESEEIAYIGEAKQLGNYKEDLSGFRLKAKEQLDNYVSWMVNNHKKYKTILIIYSVPIFCYSVTKNEIKKTFKKNKMYFPNEVICS